MARLVHRDFSEQVANYGDVVNTRRPGTFTAKRKTDADNVVNQDAVATNVQVPLDQHVYVTFTIKDGEASKSFQDLVEMYLDPAAQEMASSVDRILCGQVHQYLANRVGRLMEMDENNAKDFMLAAREKMNVNKAYPNGRNLVLSPSSETELLKTELFISAEKRGDDGSALRDASLGRVLGFDTFMDQNVPGLTLASTGYAAAVTDNAEPTGNTTIEITTTANYVASAGEYVWLEGEGKPHVIESQTDDDNTTNTIVLTEGLESAVASGANVYIFKEGYVDNTAGYAAGYAKAIKVDNGDDGLMTVEPQVGQLVSFGTGASRHTYTIIAAEQSAGGTETEIWLDRPLAGALSDDDPVFVGPAGSFNFAFHRNALALVSRPLALPNNALGVRSSVGSYNDVTMRVSMQYDINSQGTIVTLDLLCGVALLDANLGCVLLG